MAPGTPHGPSGPTLSVSMIVRNEARRLPAFLDALDGLADEICITDTGSEDESVQMAIHRGCRVQSFPWCGDFAAARNAALQPCTGTWILSLDADERIAHEDWAALRALVAGPTDHAYRFLTRNYGNDTTASGYTWCTPDDPRALGFPGWFPSTKVRLFPNRPGIAFEGAVHEMVHASLGRLGITIHDATIPVLHYPLLEAAPEARAHKQTLYLELGIKKRDARPGDPLAHHELGDQYLDMGRFGEALACYKEAVRLEPENPRWLADLGAALLLLGHVAPAIQALELALRHDPTAAECWRNLGVARVRQENWRAARDAFSRALELTPDHPENQRYLAIALDACGERPEAIALLRRLLARFPAHEEGQALLSRIQSEANEKSD